VNGEAKKSVLVYTSSETGISVIAA